MIQAILAALILTCVVGSIPDMFSPFIWQSFAHNFIHRSGLLRDCIPCRQCRFVGVSRVASRKIPRRSFRPVWSTFCIAFFAAHIFCHLNVLSTEQIAHGISESAGVKQALRRMARKSKYISQGRCCLWSIARRLRNRLAHAQNGNGKGKGKGKKGKTSPEVFPVLTDQNVAPDTVEDIREAVTAVLPEAAKLRSQSSLVQDEWDVPTVPHQALNKQDGIALVPRKELANVISRVGFTAHKVAILLTEPPENLGLAGYHREHVRIRLMARNEDGDKVETFVMRWLVQIGFGPHVTQVMQGSQADMFFTMGKMTGKMPEALGWPSGQKPAALVMNELTKHVPEEAISDIQTRHDGIAALSSHTPTMLMQSCVPLVTISSSLKKPTRCANLIYFGWMKK